MKISIPSHPVEALILARLAPGVVERARDVRLMAFDVDGVLTDGSLWYGEHGEVMKRFCALDGHGLKLLRDSGVSVALITGREGPIVARRAAELGIDLVQQGVRDKARAIGELIQAQGYDWQHVGYMGDDLIDLAALQRCGFSASVPNAPPYIGQAVHWVSSRAGGEGAVRECCDLILAAKGRLSTYFGTNAHVLAGAPQ